MELDQLTALNIETLVCFYRSIFNVVPKKRMRAEAG